jgi:predicted branched-subunit amino acid permease
MALMSLTLTFLLLAGTFLVIVYANWQERREQPLGRAPLVSYPALQMIAIVVAVLLIAHLVSLLTGQPLRGRRMP